MKMDEIFSDSLKYPFNDIKTFILVGIIVLLASSNNILSELQITSMPTLIISFILTVVFLFVLSGYGVSVIKKGIEKSDDLPSINFKKNIKDGLKILVIGIVYNIIPILILVISLSFSIFLSEFLSYEIAMAIIIIISAIVILIFNILEYIALIRFAHFDKLDEALSFSKVIEDIKKIGIVKLISFLIIMAVIIGIILLICGILTLIPYVGVILGVFLSGGYILLVFFKSLGLLYSEIIE